MRLFGSNNVRRSNYQLSTLISEHNEYVPYNITHVLIDDDSSHDVILMPSTMQESSSESISYTGMISGLVTDTNGLPIKNVSLRLSSVSSGLEKTELSDMNGQFIISDVNANLNGVPIADFILTASHPDYPSQTKQYFQNGDYVSFVFTDLNITGTIKDIDSYDIPLGIEVNVMLFEASTQKIPIKKVADSTNSDFHFTGLDADKTYQLLFHINGTSVKQWAGEKNEGIPLTSRHEAALIKAGEIIYFQFSHSWQEKIQ